MLNTLKSSPTLLPVSILQFGSGKFLRAFVDLFVHEANHEGQGIGRIVVVQSTGPERARAINQQSGRYEVKILGYQDGKTIQRSTVVNSISHAFYANNDWNDVIELVKQDSIQYIISNTSEAGYRLFDTDRREDMPPASFPGKLLQTLYARYNGSRAAITVIPCELIENNAQRLKHIIVDLACKWKYEKSFVEWLQYEVAWLHTLVDRITIDPSPETNTSADDQLLTLTEPFAFWALENHPDNIPFMSHPALVRTDNVAPYALRKVRILNGAHSALVCRAMPLGIETVREAMENREIRDWITDLVFNEIIPSLPDEVDSPVSFAEACFDRFLNPFLDHRLEAIAFEHDLKVQLRILPSYQAYVEKQGKAPPLLKSLLGV